MLNINDVNGCYIHRLTINTTPSMIIVAGGLKRIPTVEKKEGEL